MLASAMVVNLDNSNLAQPLAGWPWIGMSEDAVINAVKRLGQLRGLFLDTAAFDSTDHAKTVYTVRWFEPVAQGTEGGLFWGTTTIEAGTVGNEFFMTRGHFHERRDRGEYYGTMSGAGVLLLMSEGGLTTTQTMSPQSLHYIPGHTAHRVVNTGDSPLSFWACWPSDAGHDYDAIGTMPFGIRIFKSQDGPLVHSVRDDIHGL